VRSLLLLGLLAGPAYAFDIVGPNKCMGCHDHDPQKLWAEKKEGPKGHLNALSQLEDKRSAGWGKAIGLGDVYDLKGSCVKCHATVFKGDANAGVSCETCHGPGSGYLEPHQKKGAYADAVKLGMYDTRNSLPVWAKMCISCHVMTDKKLVAAGHPSGYGFDLSVKSFGQVVHWKETYDKAALGAAGRSAEAKLLGGPPPKEVIAAKAEPKAEPKTEPKAEAAKPTPKPEAPKPTTAAKEPPKEVPKEAPKDAPKEAEPKAAPAPTPAGETQPRPKAPRATPPPVVAEVAAPPTPPPAPLPLPAPQLTALPPSGAVAESAALRGRVLMALAKALRDRADRVKAAPPTPIPATLKDYTGPEAELLRLQDEVLALQLAALSTPAAPAGRANPSPPPKEKTP